MKYYLQKILLNRHTLVISLTLILIFLILSPFLVYQKIYTGIVTTKWDNNFLFVSLILFVYSLITSIQKTPKFKRLARYNWLLTFVLLMWAYKDYGFLRGSYFMSAFYLLRLMLVKSFPHVREKYTFKAQK